MRGLTLTVHAGTLTPTDLLAGIVIGVGIVVAYYLFLRFYVGQNDGSEVR